jgi:hypothetical protein
MLAAPMLLPRKGLASLSAHATEALILSARALHSSLAGFGKILKFPLFPAAEIRENTLLRELEDRWGV